MQCQDCDASEKITIAGKEFCANCGTLADATTNTGAIAPSTTNETAQAPAGVVAPQDFAIPTTPATVSQSQTPIVNPSPQIETSPAVAPPPSPQANQPQQSAGQIPVSAALDAQPGAPVQTQTQQPIAIGSVGNQPGNITSAPQQGSSNELGTLSNRSEEGVFSDDQLSALASVSSYTNSTTTSNQPGVIRPPAKIKHMGDIRPAGAKAPAQIATNQPQVASEPTVIPSGPVNRQAPPAQAPNAISQPPVPKPRQEHVAPQLATNMASQNTQQANTLLEQVDAKDSDTPKSSKKNRSGKIASVGLSLAGIALLGFYVWQINYPNLALKVAASKAGISASLPSYVPNGWKVAGDIQTNPGSISYTLKTKDNKTLTVNEVRSDWDSQALAENYLRDKTEKYTALQAEGLTIYMYNNNQASWINQGSWYRIEGNNHGLSQEDIVKMATSL